jgi:hypothetical protein
VTPVTKQDTAGPGSDQTQRRDEAKREQAERGGRRHNRPPGPTTNGQPPPPRAKTFSERYREQMADLDRIIREGHV